MADAKTPLTDEQRQRRRVGRTLGRGQWLALFKEANPEASKEDLKTAWTAVRKEQTRLGMRMLKTLEKNGYMVIENPDAAKAAKAA
ncbi:hypothetical protein FTO60_11130 [Octadecabacter sp. SW4]|uniref:hypothetical protein n=1 Tax=Octadecabacter sp. SW4 TaxID=2602067 RepID=UPI0011C1D84E|nr:hypothetical protein [Octadecabacter sp. SW4]QEE36211.1 hypothetical protein FTO60_11130 [Octadecabacter sp. SW4]